MGAIIQKTLIWNKRVHPRWIDSWLNGRTEQVVVDGQHSDPVSVLSGVALGSVLGLIKF